MLLETGRICIKTAGREAGKVCVVLKKIDENYVMVTGPREVTKVKRRRCNIQHLEPLEDKIKIKADAPDSEVIKEYEKEKIFEKLKIQRLTPEQIKEIKEKKTEKEAKKKEREAEKPKEEPKKKEEKPKAEKKIKEKPKKKEKKPKHKEKPKKKPEKHKAKPKPLKKVSSKKAKPAKKGKKK